MPVTAWTYPTSCAATSVQLIPCCDGSPCTSRHISAPRQYYGRPGPVGIGPYHCPAYRHHHHHHSRHRLPTPSFSGIPIPLASSVYQPQHVPSNSVVAPPSMFSSQQQGAGGQTVYHGRQMSHGVYQSSAVLNRAQQVWLIFLQSSIASRFLTSCSVYLPTLSCLKLCGDGICNMIEQNSSIFAIVRNHEVSSSAACVGGKTLLQHNLPVLNWGCWILQVVQYDGLKTFVVVVVYFSESLVQFCIVFTSSI